MSSPLAARTRLVLASASPARLRVLRDAGLDPEVMVSGVDEDGIQADTPAALATRLAQVKAEAVAPRIGAEGALVLVGCDSLLELDGVAFGKPHTPAAARERWAHLSGRRAVLHTGHHVMVRTADTLRTRTAVASTTVEFAEVTDPEIEAYVATGEPLEVAGGFTLDGLGGPFVRRIEGDPSNVVGISLPLLRVLLAELDLAWPTLWS